MADDFDSWLSEREKEAPADDGGMLRPGQRIGVYRIVRQLGVGGMGQVYEAEHMALGVRRALKVFSTESEHSEFLRKRFVAEGRILADLQHPRIVRVYDLVVDEDSGMAYFEMDLVLSPDGQPRTLADELQDGADEEKVVGWFKDICEGLAYIHSRGVVHRDISLDNILIGCDGHAVITDFGIAKIIDDSYRKKIDVTVTMVYKDGSEVRIGKERYMAPELKKPNGRASCATDAWALGVLLFRMLSGSWYDVGTRLEDWHADLKYDWHPVFLQLFNLDPKNRLGDGGIAALPALLLNSEVAIKPSINLVCDVETDKITGKKTIAIVMARNAEGDFAIPSEVDGSSVTKIGRLGFACCDKLTGVTIPESVTSIGDRAFFGCSRLTSVTIPDSVKSIGSQAFEGCSGLTSVTIGKGVTSISDFAFSGCSGLTSVTMPDGVASIGLGAFNGCSGLTSVTIPSGLTNIGSFAFSGCSGLTSMTMPDSVKSIGDSAFSGCSGLTSVTMPSDLTNIGSFAFSGCSGLTSVTIPDSVKSIGSQAFEGCSGLTSVTIGKGVTSISDFAFSGCSGLTSVTIPDGVASIGLGAFDGCSGFTSVTIPDSVKSIGGSAFSGCSGLTSVTIPSGVTSIGDWVFSGCSGLTSVTIPDSVKRIGISAFLGCGGLTNVTIPNSVKSIGKDAFFGCGNLKSVTMPGGVASIGDGAFGCTALKSVRVSPRASNRVKKLLEDSCHTIGGIKFMELDERISEDELAPGVRWRYRLLSGKAYITGIQEWVITDYDREHHELGWSWITDLFKHDVITVPSHIDGFPVYSMGINPFLGFQKLIVADGVVEIGNYGGEISIGVWDDDTLPFRLRDVVLPNTLRCIWNGAFKNCRIEDLVIPEGCMRIGNRAFDGSPSLRRIAIPKTMESIGDHAFRNCGKLEEIIIESYCCQFGKGILDGCRSIRKISGPLSRQLEAANFFDNKYL